MKGCILGVILLPFVGLAAVAIYFGLNSAEVRESVGLPPRLSDQAVKAPITDSPPPSEKTERPYNQYFDAEKAFVKDELFAVVGKLVIPEERYVDVMDRKTALGTQKEKILPKIYVVRAMGRETRENYLFIVPRNFYETAEHHEKFSKTEMSNFEYFLSEDKMHKTIFRRRFRLKMVQ